MLFAMSRYYVGVVVNKRFRRVRAAMRRTPLILANPALINLGWLTFVMKTCVASAACLVGAAKRKCSAVVEQLCMAAGDSANLVGRGDQVRGCGRGHYCRQC